MAAHDHLHEGQFGEAGMASAHGDVTIHPAGEVLSNVQPASWEHVGSESADEVWDRKFSEGERGGILDELAEQGTEHWDPVEVHPFGVVVDGTHRIAAAGRKFPDLPLKVRWNHYEGP